MFSRKPSHADSTIQVSTAIYENDSVNEHRLGNKMANS